MLQRHPANGFPDLLQVLAKLDLTAIGGLDGSIAAEYLQCRPDAGKNQVRATNALPLEPFHPVADAVGQLTEYVRPITHGRVIRTGAADEMNASRKGC